MHSSIDYFFTTASPFAYMGHEALMAIAATHGKAVNFKTFDIFKVWEKSGSTPPAQRSAVRQNYRMLEIQRIAIYRNLHINPKPKHFPTDPSLADQCVCALVLSGQDPASFAKAVGRALWEQDRQIADTQTIGEILTELHHDADDIIAKSNNEDTIAMRSRNSAQAIECEAIGAPSYVYKGEVFWGQDHLKYLDQMIRSNRDAFSSDI